MFFVMPVLRLVCVDAYNANALFTGIHLGKLPWK